MSNPTGRRISTAEFVALIAMLFSTVAFSIDAMLPAFPQIESDFGVSGQAYLIVTFFMLGLGIGTLLAGPISDAIGRKGTMFLGTALYIGAGVIAWRTDDFEILVAARLLQGVGASGPRVVSMAIVRDLYSGAQMARIVSLAMVLFTVVPTIAPALGAFLNAAFGWRSILLSFIVFSAISILWLWMRLDESLPLENRRPLHIGKLWEAAVEVARHPVVRLSILAQACALGLIMALIVQVQPIYDTVFGRADSFPYWFGGIALVAAASTSLANASLVTRFGMRRLITLGMAGQVAAASFAISIASQVPEYTFTVFVIWQFTLIWLSGLCVGNLSALALEPMGHIAGFTASVTGSVSTLLAAATAMWVGLLFDETVFPLLTIALFVALTGLLLLWRINVLSDRMAAPDSLPGG